MHHHVTGCRHPDNVSFSCDTRSRESNVRQWDGAAGQSEAVSHMVHVWSWFVFVSMRPRFPTVETQYSRVPVGHHLLHIWALSSKALAKTLQMLTPSWTASSSRDFLFFKEDGPRRQSSTQCPWRYPPPPPPLSWIQMNKMDRLSKVAFVCRQGILYPAPLSEITRALTALTPSAHPSLDIWWHALPTMPRTWISTSSTVVCCFGWYTLSVWFLAELSSVEEICNRTHVHVSTLNASQCGPTYIYAALTNITQLNCAQSTVNKTKKLSCICSLAILTSDVPLHLLRRLFSYRPVLRSYATCR